MSDLPINLNTSIVSIGKLYSYTRRYLTVCIALEKNIQIGSTYGNVWSAMTMMLMIIYIELSRVLNIIVNIAKQHIKTKEST